MLPILGLTSPCGVDSSRKRRRKNVCWNKWCLKLSTNTTVWKSCVPSWRCFTRTNVDSKPSRHIEIPFDWHHPLSRDFQYWTYSQEPRPLPMHRGWLHPGGCNIQQFTFPQAKILLGTCLSRIVVPGTTVASWTGKLVGRRLSLSHSSRIAQWAL